MNQQCTRCRQKRTRVRLYAVQAFDGDRHPVQARLCPSCVHEAKRGKAIVTSLVVSA